MAIRLAFKSDSKQARKDLSQLEQSVDRIDKNTDKATKSMDGLAKTAKIAGGILATGFAVKGLTGVSDKFTDIENRIALVTGRTKELNKAFRELQRISIQARGGLEGVADLYGRLGRSTKNLEVSQKDLLTATEAIQKAIVISAASPESAQAAIVQLGQGLAASALRGQELNSVMEQTPRVAQAIADSLGVGLGDLRALAQAGELTSEVVLNAFLNQAGEINREFQFLNATFGQGFLLVGENFGFMVREFIAGLGIVTPLTTKILSMAQSLQDAGGGARAFGESISKTLSSVIPVVRALGNVIRAIGAQIGANLPTILGPTFSIFRRFNALLVGFAEGLRRTGTLGFFKLNVSVKGFINTITGGFFRLGEFQRVAFELSRARSLQDFANALNLLAEAIDPERFTILNLGRALTRGIDIIGGEVRRLLTFTGLLDGFIFQIRTLTIQPLLLEFQALAGTLTTTIRLIFLDLTIQIRSFAGQLAVLLGDSFLGGLSRAFGDLGSAALTFVKSPLGGGIGKLFGVPREVLGDLARFTSILTKSSVKINLLPRPFLKFIEVVVKGLDLIIKKANNFDVQFFKAMNSFEKGFDSTLVKVFSPIFEAPELALNVLFGNFDIAKAQIDEFADGVSSALKFINEVTFNIDFSKSSKTLDKAKDFILSTIKKIEAGFAWLYDRVIGNSWWPDMIDGIIIKTSELVIKSKRQFLSFFGLQETGFQRAQRYASNAVDGILGTAALFDAIIISVAGTALSLTSALFNPFAAFHIFEVSMGSASRSLDIFEKSMTRVSRRSKPFYRFLNNFINLDIFKKFRRGLTKVVPALKYAALWVKGFTLFVIRKFKELYIEVVGNSWWPDTVEGVIEFSKKMFTDASVFVLDFVKVVEDSFRKTFFRTQSLRQRLTSAVDKVAGITVEIGVTLLATGLNLDTIKTTLVSTFIKASVLFMEQFRNDFPLLFQSLSSLFVQFFLKQIGAPLVARQFLLLGALLSSGLDLGPLVSAAIDFANAFARELGRAIGQTLRPVNLVKIMGSLGRALFNIADEFGEVLVENLGVVGTLLKASLLFLPGSDAAIGAVGLFLLGRVGLPLLGSPGKFFKRVLKNIKDLNKAALASGGSANTLGILGRALIGTGGSVGKLKEIIKSRYRHITGVLKTAYISDSVSSLGLLGTIFYGRGKEVIEKIPQLISRIRSRLTEIQNGSKIVGGFFWTRWLLNLPPINALLKVSITLLKGMAATMLLLVQRLRVFITTISATGWGKIILLIGVAIAAFLPNLALADEAVMDLEESTDSLGNTIEDAFDTNNYSSYSTFLEGIGQQVGNLERIQVRWIETTSEGFKETNENLQDFYASLVDVSVWDRMVVSARNAFASVGFGLRKLGQDFVATITEELPEISITPPTNIDAVEQALQDTFGKGSFKLDEVLENFVNKDELNRIETLLASREDALAEIESINTKAILRESKIGNFASTDRIIEINKEVEKFNGELVKFRSTIEQRAFGRKGRFDSNQLFDSVESSLKELETKAPDLGDFEFDFDRGAFVFEMAEAEKKELARSINGQISSILLALDVGDNQDAFEKSKELRAKLEELTKEPILPDGLEGLLGVSAQEGLRLAKEHGDLFNSIYNEALSIFREKQELESKDGFGSSVDDLLKQSELEAAQEAIKARVAEFSKVFDIRNLLPGLSGKKIEELRNKLGEVRFEGLLEQGKLVAAQQEALNNGLITEPGKQIAAIRGYELFIAELARLTETFLGVAFKDVLSGVNDAARVTLASSEIDRLKSLSQGILTQSQVAKKAAAGSVDELNAILEASKLRAEREKLIAEINKRVGPTITTASFSDAFAGINDAARSTVSDSELGELKSLSQRILDQSLILEKAGRGSATELQAVLEASKLRARRERIISKINKRAKADIETGFDLDSAFSGISDELFLKLEDSILKPLIERAKSINELERIKADIEESGRSVDIAFLRDLKTIKEEQRLQIEALKEAEKELTRDFQNLARGLGSAIVDGIVDGSIGDNIIEVFLTSIQDSLAAKISAFAEGFLETFFGGLEASKGIGNRVGEILKGVITTPDSGFNKEGQPVSEVFGFFKDIGSKVAGSLGFGSEENKTVRLGNPNVEAGLSVGSSVTEAAASLAGALGLSTEATAALEVANLAQQAITTTTTVTEVSALTANTAALIANTGALAASSAADSASSLASVFGSFSLGAATGGRISGPGTGTSDSIPMMLSDGEFVINAKAARKFGPILQAINNGGKVPGMATGGAVGDFSMVETVQASSREISTKGGVNNNTVNFNLEGDFDSRTQRAIRRFINDGSLQEGLNRSNIENGGDVVFRGN